MANVSITLQNNGDSRPIIEAIGQDNPTAALSHYPAMVKIDCERRLVVRRATIEEKLGRDFDLQELQLSLISLCGNVEEGDDEFVVAWTSQTQGARQ